MAKPLTLERFNGSTWENLNPITVGQNVYGSGTNSTTPLLNSSDQIDSAFLGNVPTEIFWATYGTTTYAQITDAINNGKEVLCKYDFDGSHSCIYSCCSLLTGAGYYFTAIYGNRTRAIITCNASSVWSNSRTNFVSGATIDETNIINTNNGISELCTINSNYNASSNKLATQSDIPQVKRYI